MRILQIGRYPPPYGGVTVHIQRLADLCHREGIDCQVIDLYRRETPEVALPPFVHHPAQNLPRGLGELYRLLRQEDTDITHVHVSSMARFAWWGRLLTKGARCGKRVLTIHHGNFVENYARGSRFQRFMIREALNDFDAVVLPTRELRDAMLRQFASLKAQLTVISSFIAPSHARIASSLGPFDEFIQLVSANNSRRSIILVSGFGFPYYGYDLLIEALKEMIAAEKRFAVVISFYGPEDVAYRRGIVRQFEAICPTLVLKDLDPEHFFYVLGHCDVYVRPTLADSCGVTVYEALMLGTPVVASDVCERPPGVFLHKTGDSSSLARQVLDARDSLAQPDKGELARSSGAEARFVELYRSLGS